MRRAASQRAGARIPNGWLAVNQHLFFIFHLAFVALVMTHKVVPLAIGILSREAVEDRHFIHELAQLVVGTRIATGFQQQHLEAGARKTCSEWSTAGARANHDVVKLRSAHLLRLFRTFSKTRSDPASAAR